MCSTAQSSTKISSDTLNVFKEHDDKVQYPNLLLASKWHIAVHYTPPIPYAETCDQTSGEQMCVSAHEPIHCCKSAALSEQACIRKASRPFDLASRAISDSYTIILFYPAGGTGLI